MKDVFTMDLKWIGELVQRIYRLEEELRTNISLYRSSMLMEEQEVMDLLKISPRTLRRYCAKQYFKRYKVGNRNVYFTHDVIRGILEHLAQ